MIITIFATPYHLGFSFIAFNVKTSGAIKFDKKLLSISLMCIDF